MTAIILALVAGLLGGSGLLAVVVRAWQTRERGLRDARRFEGGGSL